MSLLKQLQNASFNTRKNQKQKITEYLNNLDRATEELTELYFRSVVFQLLVIANRGDNFANISLHVTFFEKHFTEAGAILKKYNVEWCPDAIRIKIIEKLVAEGLKVYSNRDGFCKIVWNE